MKLTILGKYGPYPAAGGACSGYLVEQDAARVLIDCGNGILSRLQQVCDIGDLDAIVLSHLHSDHMSDIMILRYALDILKARGMYDKDPLPIYLPKNPSNIYNEIAAMETFKPFVIEEGLEVEIGSFTFTFREMTHPVQNYAVSIEDGSRRAVYTGDTNWNTAIEEFAAGADLLLADAGLLEKDKIPGKSPHLSAKEVGLIAKNAGVKRLLLTHVWPGYEEEELIQEAAIHFARPVMAQEMECLVL